MKTERITETEYLHRLLYGDPYGHTVEPLRMDVNYELVDAKGGRSSMAPMHLMAKCARWP